MPYLLFLEKQQNLNLSSAANYRWRFRVDIISYETITVTVKGNYKGDYTLCTA